MADRPTEGVSEDRGAVGAAGQPETSPLTPTVPGAGLTAPFPDTNPATLSGAFGRYRIVRSLGQGGMGAVYLAEDSQLDRQVALKVPLFSTSDPGTLARFYREARAAATIDHPNICPVYDVGEQGGVHFVTMAFVEGRTLAELIRGGNPLPQRASAAVVRKIALALQEAHARGVIHRDLKPANIMINRRKEPVVMDFGLARRVDRDEQLTRAGAPLGTPAYMPPEQVTGDPGATGPGSDVYSLGVILYQMLTGRLPFQGTVMSVLAQILTADPPAPSDLRPDIDPQLEAICRKAMAKAPGARYDSMAAFAADLTSYLRSEAPAPAALKRAPETGPATVDAGHSVGTRTSDDGKATELLGRLLDQLEARPSAPPPRPRSLLLPLVAGAVLLVVGGAAVYVLTRPSSGGGAPGGAGTTVVVQLQGLGDRVDPAVALIELDGKPVTREELAGPIHLPPGEHVVLMMRADRAVIGRYTFTVGRDDDGRAVQAAASAPDRPANLDPAKLTAGDIGNVDALKRYFSVNGVSFDPAARRVTLALAAERAIAYAPADVQLDVRLYDADDARVRSDILRFERNDIKKGAVVQAYFTWAQAGAVRRVLLVAPGETEFPPGPRPAFPKFDPAAVIPGVPLDIRAAEEVFAVLKGEYDPAGGRVTLLLEARREIPYVGREFGLEARVSDEKGALLRAYGLSFEHSNKLLKGERVRAHFTPGTGGARVVLARMR
ncbi:MAG TPA: serine/threonine-protein kinase [Gemmata sp.]